MSSSAFYDAGPLEQVAINLFYGWGYNFYRKENQLRADDQLVRNKVGTLLSSARKSVETAEQAYRRDFLPPPSREKPRPMLRPLPDHKPSSDFPVRSARFRAR